MSKSSERIRKKLVRFWHVIFFVGTIILLLFSWLDFLGFASFQVLYVISLAFLFITLYQLDAYRGVSLSSSRIPKILESRLSKLITASVGSFVYFGFNYTFGIFELVVKLDSFGLELLAGPSFFLVLLFAVLAAHDFWYFPLLRFTSKISMNQYADTFHGIIVICVFLGTGGDLFVDFAILIGAFLRLRPLKGREQIEKTFWIRIWRRRESSVNEIISGTAFVYGILAIGFNLRFLVPQNSLNWVFIALCLTPIIAAYATKPRGKRFLTIITTELVGIFCSWALILAFPSALPLTSTVYSAVARSFTNPPPWIETLPSYLWVVISAIMLSQVWIGASQHIIRKNIGGKTLVLGLFQRLVFVALLSFIVEMMFFETLIASITVRQPIQSGYYQAPFLIYRYLDLRGKVVAIVVLVSLFFSIREAFDVFGLRKMIQKGRFKMNRKRTFVLTLLVSILFSTWMVGMDATILTLYKSSYYSQGKVTFSGNFTYTYIQVVGVYDWISLNATYPENYTMWSQVLFYTFGYPFERSNSTGGQSRIVFENLSPYDYYLEFGIYDIGNSSSVDFLFTIERGRPTILSGGPLSVFPVGNFLLILPILYLTISPPKMRSTARST